MQQLQITIPAVSPVAVSPVAVSQDAAPTLKYMLLNRPVAGNGRGDLAAHTCAAFEALGLFNGASVSRATLVRVWGQTAINWHMGGSKKPAAFNTFDENGMRHYELNEVGVSRFIDARTIDPARVDMFYALMTEGKAGDDTPISYRAVKPV